MSNWEVIAVKYPDRNARVRTDNFMFDDNHDAPHAMDYFIWQVRRGNETILVDTGYDEGEVSSRQRPIRLNPHLFTDAMLHLLSAEMGIAAGPIICHDTLRLPFTAVHTCEAVRRLYSGQMIFHDGEGQVSDGITVHCIGGHSRGLQCDRVRTQVGWLVLASDATHFYLNFFERNLIVPRLDPLVQCCFPEATTPHITRLDVGPMKEIAS